MLTECPSCLTVFRVTGAILKMGHGQVRCGKCRTQFDALDSLLDDDDSEKANGAAGNKTRIDPTLNQAPEPTEEELPEEEAIEAPAPYEPEIAEEITMEGSRIEISGTYRVPGTERDGQFDHGGEQVIREHVVIDRGAPVASTGFDSALQDSSDDETYIEINADDGEPVAEAASHLLADSDSAQQAETPLPLSQRIWKRPRPRDDMQGSPATAPEIDAELYALARPQKPPREVPKGWTAASVVLAIALVLQVVHHYRDPLVRSPKWGETVSRVYRALGLSLTPHWDLNAYEVQQWGVISDGAARDALRVRASVTNTATFAQPYPLIKLQLEDRWGAPVAEREFAPEEYLPVASANRMMAPRQRANAEIVIVDPGADAVGFHVHPCLVQAQGLICSDDAPAAQ